MSFRGNDRGKGGPNRPRSFSVRGLANKSKRFNFQRTPLSPVDSVVEEEDAADHQDPDNLSGMDAGEDASAARRARFGVKLAGNRYPELQRLREKERQTAVAKGHIQDPSAPSSHSTVRDFKGTCQYMCPVFEAEEREAKLNVDKWELLAGTTNRIDHSKAVKAYHRSAAGNEQPLPTDVRTPAALKKTLKYLFEELLAQDPTLRLTHSFIRDRTRSIRQDFTVQHEQGDIAIDCHERMARYHIHVLHVLGSSEGFSVQQEMEQLRKVLTSLIQFYSDGRSKTRWEIFSTSPNEAEFSSYLLLTHLFDADILRQTEALPSYLFYTPSIQLALTLAYLAQRSNDPHPSTTRIKPNSALSQNFSTRLFKELRKKETPYLVGCLMESHFGEIRKAALLAMCSAARKGFKPVPVEELVRMLGFDGVEDLEGVCSDFGLKVETGENGELVAVELNRDVVISDHRQAFQQRFSKTIVDVKRQGFTNIEIINGQNSNYSPSLSSGSFTTPLFSPPKHLRSLPSPQKPSGSSTFPFFAFLSDSSASASTSTSTSTSTSVQAPVFPFLSSPTTSAVLPTPSAPPDPGSPPIAAAFGSMPPGSTISSVSAFAPVKSSIAGNPFAFPPRVEPSVVQPPSVKPTKVDVPVESSSIPLLLPSADLLVEASAPSLPALTPLLPPPPSSPLIPTLVKQLTPPRSSNYIPSTPRSPKASGLTARTIDVLTNALLAELLPSFLRSTASQALSLAVLDEIASEDAAYSAALGAFKRGVAEDVVLDMVEEETARVVGEEVADEWRRRWGLRVAWEAFRQSVGEARVRRLERMSFVERVDSMGFAPVDGLSVGEPELTLTDLIYTPRVPPLASSTNDEPASSEAYPLHRSLAPKTSSKRPRSSLLEDEPGPAFYEWIERVGSGREETKVQKLRRVMKDARQLL